MKSNYILSLKYIAGFYIKKNNIAYTEETLVTDCINFINEISNLTLNGDYEHDLIESIVQNNLNFIKYICNTCNLDNIKKNTSTIFHWSIVIGNMEIINYLFDYLVLDILKDICEFN